MAEAGPTPPPPPGWYDDPWGSPSKRWWDGQQWTGHLQAGGPTGTPVVPLDRQLESERSSARFARMAMLWGGPAQALSTFTTALWVRDFADEFREALDTDGDVDFETIGNGGAILVNQLTSMAFLAAGVLFLIWFYRSTTLARDAGLPARRSPGLAVASWIIPIVNWWWPYRATVDALPRHHPGQPQLLRWWLLWIGASSSGLFVGVVGFFSVGAMWIVAAAGVGLSLAAAFAARDVIEIVVEAHEELIQR